MEHMKKVDDALGTAQYTFWGTYLKIDLPRTFHTTVLGYQNWLSSLVGK